MTSSITTYPVMEDGERVRGEARKEALEEGYASTLLELRDTGAEVAVIKDNPHPDKDIPDCVSKSLDDLQRCAIPRQGALDYPQLYVRAAEETEGVRVIDATFAFCLEERCPAVIGDTLVYRNTTHLTPAYVRSLAPWLGERLPEPAD